MVRAHGYNPRTQRHNMQSSITKTNDATRNYTGQRLVLPVVPRFLGSQQKRFSCYLHPESNSDFLMLLAPADVCLDPKIDLLIHVLCGSHSSHSSS